MASAARSGKERDQSSFLRKIVLLCVALLSCNARGAAGQTRPPGRQPSPCVWWKRQSVCYVNPDYTIGVPGTGLSRFERAYQTFYRARQMCDTALSAAACKPLEKYGCLWYQFDPDPTGDGACMAESSIYEKRQACQGSPAYKQFRCRRRHRTEAECNADSNCVWKARYHGAALWDLKPSSNRSLCMSKQVKDMDYERFKLWEDKTLLNTTTPEAFYSMWGTCRSAQVMFQAVAYFNMCFELFKPPLECVDCNPPYDNLLKDQKMACISSQCSWSEKRAEFWDPRDPFPLCFPDASRYYNLRFGNASGPIRNQFVECVAPAPSASFRACEAYRLRGRNGTLVAASGSRAGSAVAGKVVNGGTPVGTSGLCWEDLARRGLVDRAMKQRLRISRVLPPKGR